MWELRKQMMAHMIQSKYQLLDNLYDEIENMESIYQYYDGSVNLEGICEAVIDLVSTLEK